jgi:hypothetical protein
LPCNASPHRHRILHAFRFRGLRGMLWNPLFRPSHDSLLRQNEEIDRLDLPRIQDDDELEALKASGELVPIEESESLKIERSLIPHAAIAVRGPVISCRTFPRFITASSTHRSR